MKKTDAKPGKAAVMKLKEDEEQLVIDWINTQSIYADSMRYLIQKEIAENGVRNLQLFIPRIRDIETIRQQIVAETASPLSPNSREIEHKEPISLPILNIEDVNSLEKETTYLQAAPIMSNNDLGSKGIDTSDSKIIENAQDPSKRKASKKFDISVIDSYQ